MGLSHTVSEINGDFGQKSQHSHPVYYSPTLTGFPLELDIGERSHKIRMMGLPDGQKSFKIGLAV